MAVAALSGDAYGMTVRDLVKRESGRVVSLGAVHATLYRLQDKGLLISELGGSTDERGGRRKRLFTLTSAGAKALSAADEARRRLISLMPKDLRPGFAS